jgi:hypothetical protein
MIAHRIQKILENAHFKCSEHIPEQLTDGLFVFLDHDKLERERILHISCRPLQFQFPEMKSNQDEKYYNIQFLIQLPFTAQSLSANQISSLLLFINHNMEWPGFDFDEVNNKISYRYIWLMKDSAIDATLLLNIVATISLNLDLFSETIEQVALGHSTFNEILQKITK